MTLHPNARLALVAGGIVVLDQASKQAVLRMVPANDPDGIIVLDGFFKLVHWVNTGAAWSLFHGQNTTLAVISAVALVLLFLARKHFAGDSLAGYMALGLMFGGIVGNLIDRLTVDHVIDFLRFEVQTRGGEVAGFPAFNVADSAICVGVGILFLLSWKREPEKPAAEAPPNPS